MADLSNQRKKDGQSLEELVLKMAASSPHGVVDEEIQKALPQGTTANQRLQIYNSLLQHGRLVLKKRQGVLFYQAVDEQSASKLQSLSAEERLVHSHIESAGNKGVWTRDLRVACRLQQAQLTKILKSLELKKLVRPIKSIKSKNKKLYMLYDIEPSIDITGGPWYCNQEFDAEFFDILYQQALRFLRESTSAVTVEELASYITTLGISREKLEVEDFKNLLQTIVYDGLVEKFNKTNDHGITTVFYRPSRISSPFATLTEVPCGICPIFQSCTINGIISPINCVYLRQWEQSLEF
eukprot:jgi/Galph1/5993/GphlegSOOS_G4613.1